MKAAVLVGVRKFEIKDEDIPAFNLNEVLVRVKACGVCQSETPMWLGEVNVNYPAYIGHEVSGIVEETGSNVKRFKKGERVTMRGGRGYSEYVNVPEEDVVNIDTKIPFVEALGDPIGCSVNVMKRCGITIGDNVAIIGVGFMGLILIQLVKLYGPSKIIAIDVREDSLSIAKKLGADITINSNHIDVVDEILKLTVDKEGVDVVFEVAGKQETLNISSRVVKYRGRMIIVGYHSVGLRTIDMQQMGWNGIDMINGHDRVGEVRVDGIKRGVELIKGGRLTLKPLITNIYNLDQINEAFEDAYDKPKGYIKSVIVM